MSFIQRLISAKFQLGTNADGTPAKPFTESGSDTLTISGLRMSATVNKAATPGGATLQMQIYGMTLSQMNQLATLGMVYSQIKRNTITVLAGDASAPLATVFIGTILQAWINFDNMPDVAFHIEAQTLAAEAVISAQPTSISGGVDVAQMMGNFAQQMGCSFENSGVSAKLPVSYFYGSIPNQAAACANAAGINWFVDNEILAIWPKGKSRAGTIPLISTTTGLIGYPGFTAYGLMLKTLFNPELRFGASVKVQSSLATVSALNTTGIWTIYSLDHEIESMVAHGKWYTSIVCYNPAFPRQTAP